MSERNASAHSLRNHRQADARGRIGTGQGLIRSPNLKVSVKLGVGVLSCAIAAAVLAATALKPASTMNVSQTPTGTEKAKAVRLAYFDGSAFRKVWLYTYGDGPVGRQDVYARHSFDDGVSWSAPVLLSRDAAGAATGGQSITVRKAEVPAAAAPCSTKRTRRAFFVTSLTTVPGEFVSWLA